MNNMQYDIIILGAGPGGYVAAIRAAQLGMKVALVEKEHLGGICLNWGCIPTKALLRSAEVYHLVSHAAEYGIEISKATINFEKMIKRSREVSSKLASGVKYLMTKNKVNILNGYGKLLGNGKISISSEDGKSETISGKNIILATGAKARKIPGIELSKEFLWTYKEAMTPPSLPKNILVIGSGAIGIEFASFYNMLGSNVTVIDIAERILQTEDHEVAKAAQAAFEKRGMKIYTSTKISSAKVVKNQVEIALEGQHCPKILHADVIISAIGVTPNTEDIGLNNTKVKLENGSIKTNQHMQTDEPNVYAIGDIVAAPWLAHKASEEAVLCVEKIANLHPHSVDRNNIPGCIYSYPQMASIGLTEDNAKKAGYNIKVGKFAFSANGKAIALGDTEGFCKLIFDSKTGEILGAHMIGPEVTEMIQGLSIAKHAELTDLDIINAIFPHPTLSEAIKEAALDADNRALHY